MNVSSSRSMVKIEIYNTLGVCQEKLIQFVKERRKVQKGHSSNSSVKNNLAMQYLQKGRQTDIQ